MALIASDYEMLLPFLVPLVLLVILFFSIDKLVKKYEEEKAQKAKEKK